MINFLEINTRAASIGTKGVVRGYAWDAENPGAAGLIVVEPLATPVDANRRVLFVCDHLGRRMQELVLERNSRRARDIDSGRHSRQFGLVR